MADLSEWGKDLSLLPLVDALKGTRDWKEALIEALKRGGQNLGVIATPEKKALMEEAASIMPQVRDPARRQLIEESAQALGSGGIGKAGLIGALRSRGDPSLYALHGTALAPPRSSEPGGDIIPKQLTAPSFSVRKYHRYLPDTEIPFYRDAEGTGRNTLVVPRVGASDPASNTATIYNRDAYTAAMDKFGGDLPEKWDTDTLKFGHAMSGDIMAGENSSYGAAVVASPEFRSAKSYERHPLGSRLLMNKMVGNETYAPHDEAYNIAAKKYGSIDPEWDEHSAITVMKGLRDAAKTGDMEARKYLKLFAEAPSNYGELKFRGPLALTPERIAGLVIHQDAFNPPSWLKHYDDNPHFNALRGQYSSFKDDLIKELRRKKLPYHIVGDNEGAAAMMDLANSVAPFGGR